MAEQNIDTQWQVTRLAGSLGAQVEGVSLAIIAADEAELLASAPAYRVVAPYIWVSLPASPAGAEIFVTR